MRLKQDMLTAMSDDQLIALMYQTSEMLLAFETSDKTITEENEKIDQVLMELVKRRQLVNTMELVGEGE